MTQEMFMDLRNEFIQNNKSVGANKLYSNLYEFGMKIAFKYQLTFEDKEDAVSEAIYDAFKGIEHYTPDFKWNTWFGTITKRKLIDYVRKNKSRGGNSKFSIDSFFTKEDGNTSPFDLPDSSLDITDLLDLEEKRNFIRRKIDELPEGKMKDVAYLAFVEGLSNSEIMKKLNMSKSNVATLKFRFIESIKGGLGLI